MYYLNARYYSPELMRFINRDTYDLSNRYAYCNGDPTSKTDPNGHMAGWTGAMIAGAGTVIGLFLSIPTGGSSLAVTCGWIGTSVLDVVSGSTAAASYLRKGNNGLLNTISLVTGITAGVAGVASGIFKRTMAGEDDLSRLIKEQGKESSFPASQTVTQGDNNEVCGYFAARNYLRNNGMNDEDYSRLGIKDKGKLNWEDMQRVYCDTNIKSLGSKSILRSADGKWGAQSISELGTEPVYYDNIFGLLDSLAGNGKLNAIVDRQGHWVAISYNKGEKFWHVWDSSDTKGDYKADGPDWFEGAEIHF